MKNYLVIIKEKITQKLSLEKINIVDNSHKHRKHKFFDSKKRLFETFIGTVFNFRKK